VNWSIREAGPGADDLQRIFELTLEVDPDEATPANELAAMDRIYPGTRRFVAEAGDRVVGAASAGRIFVHAPEYDGLWMNIHVRPESRRQGIGTALFQAISDASRPTGKTAFETDVREDRTDGVEFLRHRGFKEHGRDKLVALDLRGRQRPDVTPPDGIAFTTLAERPELRPGVHAVAVEAFADIPVTGEPIEAGTYEEFTARDVDVDSVPKEAFVVALDQATGTVVGYASLALTHGPGRRAFHDMTAVLRAWRGRGIAKALKQATIGWAIDAGLEALDTGNDLANGPMRAVNIGLGYQPLPDLVGFRGPLASPRP
jgi:mycothiol synthase